MNRLVNSTKRNHWLLVFIFVIFLAGFFRLYDFPSNPPSLNWDEVAIAYNAHSIIQTGRDEYGQFIPLIFRSFDDYKMPVYVYLTALSQLIFGYNDFSVRIPAAFFGILTVIVVYLLTSEITKKKQIALLASLFLAVLPWHVQFTRYAHETSVGLFLLLSGVLTMLWGIRKSNWWFIVSSVCFALSMHTYLSYRMVTPVIVLIFTIFFWKKASIKHPSILIAIVIFASSALLVVYQVFGQAGTARFAGVSILNEHAQFDQEYKRIQYEGTLNINLPRRLFHQPEYYLNALLVAHGYIKHFNPDYIFFDRGLYHHSPNVGFMYTWMIFFIPIGLYYLFKSYSRQSQIIIITLLLVAPTAAAFTIDIPHPMRAILLCIPLTMLTAIGVWTLYENIKKNHRYTAYGFFVVMTIIIVLSSWNFMRQYTIHFPHERYEKWMYGRRELVRYLESVKNEYDAIIISPRVEWPHIFVLYYSQYDPEKYLTEGGTVSGSWDSEQNAFDKYEFRTIQPEDKTKKVLYVDIPENISPEQEKLYTIKNPDGTDGIYVIKIN